MRPDVIIAYEKDGVPLPETLRLVIPGANGGIWIGLITSITIGSTYISEGQLDTIAATTMQPSQWLTNSTNQPSPTQQPQVQPQPPATNNNTVTKPLATPANATQPEQKAIGQQDAGAQASGFPVQAAYGMVVAWL